MYITRTITTYKHTFIRFEGGAVLDTQEKIFAVKLGARTAARYMKENGMDDYVLAKIEDVQTRYRMKVEDFINAAEIINDEEG